MVKIIIIIVIVSIVFYLFYKLGSFNEQYRYIYKKEKKNETNN